MKFIPWIAMFLCIWIAFWTWYLVFAVHWAFVTLAVPVTGLAVTMGILLFADE